MSGVPLSKNKRGAPQMLHYITLRRITESQPHVLFDVSLLLGVFLMSQVVFKTVIKK